ncbi:hypothetical protein AMATHDRAFT_6716 [Amanita thiersii Skay4041]|uniref:HPP transmembrane region domain-containing protein n=1 Tax=Amanita thiersii Skay4041 TaxID=703135 RepID=A0A2A9NA08_9AGAR|nr:hypothetical protein AMATHDRAFT_6716 [Amanita thiersii Skay4041]
MTITLPRTPAAFRVSRWPSWLSRWVGYRATPQAKIPMYIALVYAFIGVFGALSVLQALFGRVEQLMHFHVPPIVYSYGSVVLIAYVVPESPMGQPRALVGGHFIGALIGVCITKLFLLLPTESRFDELLWLVGSLCCGLSIVLMQMTRTVHPPAGATAVLASVNVEIREMGWFLLPVVLISSLIILVLALIINNIQRQYPIFWIRPEEQKETKTDDIESADVNAQDDASSSGSQTAVEVEVRSWSQSEATLTIYEAQKSANDKAINNV